jgi:hypothetical protein
MSKIVVCMQYAIGQKQNDDKKNIKPVSLEIGSECEKNKPNRT